MPDQTTALPPSIFTTKHDEDLTFPFFETEDGTIIGGGHHDKATFAAAVTAYDEVTSGMGYITSPDSVEWKYATTKRKDGEWWFTWSKKGEPVTSTTPGAIAITLVIR